MKICLISFDYWGFDSHIIKELKQGGHEAYHINLDDFKYKHPSFPHRLKNFFTKVVLKKNIKRLKRQEYVLEALNKMGHMDSILVIRPDLLDVETHQANKRHTTQYIAYLYDSTKRFAVNHLLDGLFSKIYSFDENDVKQYGFQHLTNYIYLPKKEIAVNETYKQQVFIVISADERLKILNKIASQLQSGNISHKFIVKANRKPAGLHENIEFTKNEIWHDQLIALLDESEIFLDLIRHGHNGLSFRVFEALAHQKKLITTNASIKNYDFYNPQNIAVIDPDNINIDPSFFSGSYEPLSNEVYNKYTIKEWVRRVFS
jgi:hypothetical protein